MKNTILTLTFAILIALSMNACAWKPDVTAVPITPPWSTMNLPIKENSVVWKSTPDQFRAVHREDKKTILGKYTDALKASGWKLSKFDDKVKDIMYVDMEKAGETIAIEIYDFEGTGVLIEKK